MAQIGHGNACLVKAPLVFAWTAVSFADGSLVCADQTSHRGGVLWRLFKGDTVVAATATTVGRVINFIIGVIARRR
jgi:hypothetical protein